MNKERFKNLQHLNLILTNACNKKCDYCYEQHNKLYANFTVDSLKEAYDFLDEVSDEEEKHFQFFGGEPLLQKGLILEFLRKYQREIELHPEIRISMITNGTLLTDAFIQEYYNTPNSQIMISLDSHKSDVEHRHSSQAGVDKILEFCEKITRIKGDLTIRCTLSRETLPHLEEFIQVLKGVGVNNMIVHPLTLSAEQGFIEWTEEEWTELERVLKNALDDNEFAIHFSEGTGTRSCDTNCMVGSSMIAMDGTGDYSGCYFFTNQKEALPDTLLGNIFDKVTHEDRYEEFGRTYEEHFAKDEKCRTCELENYCYQCPAGNLSTGSKKMFRSDSMCQRIVKLFLMLRRDENHKKFFKLVKRVGDAHEEEGDIVFSRSVFQLVYRLQAGSYIPFESLKRMKLPHYEKLMGFIVANPSYDFTQDIGTIRKEVEAFTGAVESRHFLNLMGADSGSDNDVHNISLLHFVMSPNKHKETTLTERLEKQLKMLSA
jgi:radical SAM protein with 4Fe4S-binding SPASM domain